MPSVVFGIAVAPSPVWRHYNHTFKHKPLLIANENVINCPCGHSTFVLPHARETGRVTVCSHCRSWHSILFK